MDPSELLNRYKFERRRLLDFVLSSALGRVNLSDPEMDTVSVDYVLDCVRSGGEFNLSEATGKYYDEFNFPIMLNSTSGNQYFLLSDPGSSGSPPLRNVPQIEAGMTLNSSTSSMQQQDHFLDAGIGEIQFLDEHLNEETNFAHWRLPNDCSSLSLGLPKLKTGLSDEDIQETAYELLVASVIMSCGDIDFEEGKKHRSSRSLMNLGHGRDKSSSYSEQGDYLSNMLEVIRIQMEISEVMDVRTKHALRHLSSRMIQGETDVPCITLELLSSINMSNFTTERAFARWHERQANVLEEIFNHSGVFVPSWVHPLSLVLSKIRNKEERFWNIDPYERAEVLDLLREYTSGISKMSGKFGIPSETYYWTASYGFNLNIYEKLLFSVFDVLEDGKIMEEAEEILIVLKLTRPMLGITPKIHSALYSWVLFEKFLRTGEKPLLSNLVTEILKVLNQEDGGDKAYISILICKLSDHRNGNLNLLDALFFNINAWCNWRLEDFHSNFSEDTSNIFEEVVTLVICCGKYFRSRCLESNLETCPFIKYLGKDHTSESELASTLLHLYVDRSTRAAYRRAVDSSILKCKTERKHYLSLLVEELMLVAGRQSTLFTPVLCQHYPAAGIHSLKLIHQLYGKQLKPFLEGIAYLSEGVRSVLAASESLERFLGREILSSSQNNQRLLFAENLQLYHLDNICQPLILQWLNAQNNSMLEWTRRALNIEDWAPLSSQQRQAVSIVEVFRIIEEDIEQFLNLKLPVDVIHLRYLLIGITHSLEAYVQHIISQQVMRDVLYPRAPALTRYKESTYPFLKKKLIESVALEEKKSSQLNHLTAVKLCVKLNTLHYIREKLDVLEDSIHQTWMIVRQGQPPQNASESEGCSVPSGSIDELFTIFDDVRRSTVAASDTIVNFIGTRIIFWDMKDSFLSSLYEQSVESNRLEMIVPQLDEALNHICDLLFDILWDQVVLSVFQASVDGYVWILLEGGPARAFAESDVTMMQEDLNVLKELFIADGQGLSHIVVEKEAQLAQEILDLYAMKADKVIELLISRSQQLSYPVEGKKLGGRISRDADTLLRVLCHKKDKVASKYLKIQYNLPKSSDYEENRCKELSTSSPFLSEILKRSATSNWTETGQRSFRMIRKKLQEATSEVRFDKTNKRLDF